MAGDELQSADDEMICAVLVRAENRMQTALQKKKRASQRVKMAELIRKSKKRREVGKL